MSQKIRAIVAGATGYSGIELIKLLLRHSQIELVGAFASRTAETLPLSAVHPQLVGQTALQCQPFDEKTVAQLEPSLIFLGTPNEFSNEIVPSLLQTGATVVDLSGAWRLKDASLYPKFYGFETHAPQLLKQAVYGLTEFAYEQLRGPKLIANPGCYPTTVQIPLLAFGILSHTLLGLVALMAGVASIITGFAKLPHAPPRPLEGAKHR